MRRAKFALLVLAVLVNLSFAAACGGGGGTDTVSPSPSVSPSVSPTGSVSPSPSPTGTLPPLAVTAVSPLDAAVNVATFVQVSIAFNKAMSTAATQDAFSLEGPDGAIEGMFYWLTGDTVMTFTPLSILASGATYSVAVSTAATASDGIETLSPAFSSSFQTIAADQVSPTVVSSTPANLAGSIDVSSNIVLEFSEAMTRTTVEGAFSLREVGSTSVITGAFSWSTDSKTVTFNPASNMGFARNMMVALAVEAQSAGGIPLQAPYSSFFTTADDPANPPSVTFIFPTDQMTDLPTNIQVIIRFSQEMNKTATQGAFSLTPEDGVPLEGLFLWVSNTDMTFQPAERLLPGTTCYIVITTDAVSASGVHIATTFNSVFVTGTGSATHTAVPTMGTIEATVLDAPPFGTLWQVTAGAATAIDDADFNITDSRWSPSGGRVLYRRYTALDETNNPEAWDLYLWSGTTPQKVNDDNSSVKLYSWSPDGTQLAYFELLDSQWSLVVRVIGGGSSVVRQTSDTPGMLFWNSASMLAWTEGNNLYQGSATVTPALLATDVPATVRISPSRRRIAYVSSSDLTLKAYSFDTTTRYSLGVFVMSDSFCFIGNDWVAYTTFSIFQLSWYVGGKKYDNSSSRAIASGIRELDCRVVGGSGSPTGSYLVYYTKAANSTDPYKAHIFNLSTSTAVATVDLDLLAGTDPFWGPDGSFVLVSSPQTRSFMIGLADGLTKKTFLFDTTWADYAVDDFASELLVVGPILYRKLLGNWVESGFYGIYNVKVEFNGGEVSKRP